MNFWANKQSALLWFTYMVRNLSLGHDVNVCVTLQISARVLVQRQITAESTVFCLHHHQLCPQLYNVFCHLVHGWTIVFHLLSWTRVTCQSHRRNLKGDICYHPQFRLISFVKLHLSLMLVWSEAKMTEKHKQSETLTSFWLHVSFCLQISRTTQGQSIQYIPINTILMLSYINLTSRCLFSPIFFKQSLQGCSQQDSSLHLDTRNKFPLCGQLRLSVPINTWLLLVSDEHLICEMPDKTQLSQNIKFWHKVWCSCTVTLFKPQLLRSRGTTTPNELKVFCHGSFNWGFWINPSGAFREHPLWKPIYWTAEDKSVPNIWEYIVMKLKNNIKVC